MIIYKITNTVNQKNYIGQTIRSIEKRMGEHLDKANKNSCMLISRAIAKYSSGNFEINEIDRCSTKSELNDLEKYWIKFYRSNNLKLGYNLTEGGDGGDIIKGLPNKLEIYKRRADSNRGKTRSDEFKKRNGDLHRGKKISDEQKQKLREHNLGKKHSDETKEKIRISILGKKHSNETRTKISKATLGKPHPNTWKQIMIDGIVYNSLTEASEILNIITSVIHYRLNSLNKKFNTYKYL